MAKRLNTGGGTAGPSGQRPAPRAGVSGGRLMGIALICLLVVVAGYLIWTFATSRGSPTARKLTPEMLTEEQMAIMAARRGYPEDLEALNEKRKAEGKPPIVLEGRAGRLMEERARRRGGRD